MNINQITSLIVVGILILASIVTKIILRIKPSPEIDRVWLRVKAWWFIALIPLGFLHLGSVAISLLFAGVSVLAIFEFYKLIDCVSSNYKIVILTLLSYFVSSIATDWLKEEPLFWPILFLGLLISWLTLVKIQKSSKHKFFLKLAGLVFMPLALSLIATTGNYEIIFFLLFLTSFNDVSQYLSGKAFGRTLLAPTISPKKTWEGFIGGILFTGSLGVALGSLLLPLRPLNLFFISAALSIAGTIGDLTISILKRQAAVSDTGNLLPGHGGVLDRIDSLLFTAPFIYFIIHTKGIL